MADVNHDHVVVHSRVIPDQLIELLLREYLAGMGQEQPHQHMLSGGERNRSSIFKKLHGNCIIGEGTGSDDAGLFLFSGLIAADQALIFPPRMTGLKGFET